ncbi:ATP-dependent_RNA helicase [Hexamita inflata]|uniref:ATP-dependent_RNA helicase n=1 Tax=Hexamita inflata TaxID=28002 RepID=A0ABP1JUE1_9EUKA
MQKDAFINMLQEHKTVLVTGPTGCGKSTNIPIWITQTFPESKTLLTQPRRLPTQKIAERICQMAGYEMTKEVGFVMGRRYFESSTNRLVLATTGSAVNLIMSKPDYYDFVIIDEIHEVSDQIQQIMALVRELQKVYKFKIVLMSATVDQHIIEAFEDTVHFVMAPQEHADSYAVDSQAMKSYQDEEIVLLKEAEFSKFLENPQLNKIQKMQQDINKNMAIQILRIVAGDVTPKYEGDILAFVPGIKEFETVGNAVRALLKKYKFEDRLDIKYLHSRFSEELKQDVLVNDKRKRTLIISTTICETSLTIPTLSYVIDSCLARKMIKDELTTVACSYDAVIQRMGRIGRCASGLYIPAINAEFLDLLQENYEPEDPTQSIDQFILKFFNNQKVKSSTTPQILLTQTSNKIKVEEVNRIYKQLLQQKYLIQDTVEGQEEPQTFLTIPGMAVANYQSEFQAGVQFFFMSLLNLPITTALVMASTQKSDLQIFVHDIELELNWKRYQQINALPFICFIQFYAFIHGDKHNFLQFSKKIEAALPLKAPLSVLYEMISEDVNSLNVNSYSESFTNAKIVALWRSRFPVPTAEPTDEELEWCQQRLLSASALREVELEAIHILNKYQSMNQNVPINFIDGGLLQVRWPCTKQQLHDFFAEKEFDYLEFDPKKREAVWEEAKIKFCGKEYTPTIVQFLKDEKKIGREKINQLLSLVYVCKNNFATFFHTKQNKLTKLINNKILKDQNPKSIKKPLKISCKPRKCAGVVPDKKQFEEAFLNFCKQQNIKNVKIAPNVKGDKVQSIDIRPNDGSMRSLSWVFSKLMCGPDAFRAGKFAITDFKWGFYQRDLEWYFKSFNNSIPNSLSKEAEIDIEDSPENNEEKSEKEAETEINTTSGPQQLPSNYKMQDAFTELTQMNPNKLGQNLMYKLEQAQNALNFFTYDDFSIFTCDFYMRNAKNVSVGQGGFVIYILASIMMDFNSQICFEYVNEKVAKIAIKSNGKYTFALQIDMRNKGDLMILDFFEALTPLSKIYENLLKTFKRDTKTIKTNAISTKEGQCKIETELFDTIDMMTSEKVPSTFRSALNEIFEYFAKFQFSDRTALACMGAYEFDPNTVEWDCYSFANNIVLENEK